MYNNHIYNNIHFFNVKISSFFIPSLKFEKLKIDFPRFKRRIKKYNRAKIKKDKDFSKNSHISKINNKINTKLKKKEEKKSR